MNTNRVMVFDGPHKLHIEERPIPRPGPDEVVIRIAFTGICGSDLHGYTGETGRRIPGMVMGHEASGWISEVGANVNKSNIGDQVTFNPGISCGGSCGHKATNRCDQFRVIGVDPKFQGAFADYISVPFNRVVSLNGMSFEFGACIEPFAVAVQAVRQSGMTSGESVLIAGGGMIGQCIAQVARAEGAASVTISETSEFRRAFANTEGFNSVSPGDLEGYPKFDRAFDAVGLSTTASATISSVKKGGTVCFVGLGSPQISIPLFEVVTAERNIQGTFAYTDDSFEYARDLLSSNRLSIQSLLGPSTDFDGVSKTFKDLTTGVRNDVKVLMRTE